MNFCPHCHSGHDPVLSQLIWSCGNTMNDPQWRTKECYKRNLELANERIKRLDDIIKRAATRFFADGSDGKTASDMLTILDEAREAKP